MPTARRNNFPLLALSLPIWIGFIALFLGLGNAAAGESVTVGGGRRAMAAGIAEAHIPLKWALYAVTFVCVLYAIRQPKTDGHINKTCFIVLALSLAIIMPLHIWFANLLLDPASSYEVRRIRIAVTLAAIPAVVVAMSLGFVVRGRGSEPRLSRTASLVSAAIALPASLLIREVIVRLQQVAASP